MRSILHAPSLQSSTETRTSRQQGVINARGSNRRHPAHPDRARLQGIPGPASPGGDRRLRHRPAPRAQPRRRSRADPGCDRRRRYATGPAGLQHRADHGSPLRQARGGNDRGHRLAVLRVLSRRDPACLQRDQERRGRRIHRCRSRVRLALQRAQRGRRRRRPQREAHRRPRGLPERLHRHGDHRGQRRQQVRRHPRSDGRLRAAIPAPRRRLAGVGLLRSRDRPGEAGRRQRGEQGRRPPSRRRRHAREARISTGGIRRRRCDGRQLLPAQRRRGRGSDHVRHEGQGAWA